MDLIASGHSSEIELSEDTSTFDTNRLVRLYEQDRHLAEYYLVQPLHPNSWSNIQKAFVKGNLLQVVVPFVDWRRNTSLLIKIRCRFVW